MASDYRYVHQHGGHISSYMKADPDVKKYFALFDVDRFIVFAVG